MENMQNAIIESASIEIEDHGILTSMIVLKYDGGGQGFGGLTLEGKYLAIWVRIVLDVVGVDKWSQLEGKHIRVEQEKPFGKIVRIGNILEDKWFNPTTDLEET